MSISLFTGRKELTMAEYEAIVEIDPNKEYNVLDYPQLSITNEQMAYALTCNRLFPEGSSFICSDDGTYKKGVAYKIIINPDGSKEVVGGNLGGASRFNNSTTNKTKQFFKKGKRRGTGNKGYQQ